MKNNKANYLAGLAIALSFQINASAQTPNVWSGDNVFEGNVGVGTTSDKGNLTVTGETGNSAAPGISVTGDGGVVFGGTFGTGQIPATGAGTRFMWYPKKAALRAGTASDAEWDDSEIGDNSIALGSGTASGSNSMALLGGTALGNNSLSIGNSAAIANNSIAMFDGAYSTGEHSIALMGGTVDFDFGFALWGMANGNFTLAVFGSAVADGAMALGTDSFAYGKYSTAIGPFATAASYSTFVTGRFNVQDGDQMSWIESDPLFVVGNGTGDNINDPPEVASRNAFLVRKNGDVEMSGKVTMPRQGDILMGDFGNPE